MSGGCDQSVRLWEVSSERCIHRFELETAAVSAFTVLRLPPSNDDNAAAAAESGDELLVAGTVEGSVYVFSLSQMDVHSVLTDADSHILTLSADAPLWSSSVQPAPSSAAASAAQQAVSMGCGVLAAGDVLGHVWLWTIPHTPFSAKLLFHQPPPQLLPAAAAAAAAAVEEETASASSTLNADACVSVCLNLSAAPAQRQRLLVARHSGAVRVWKRLTPRPTATATATSTSDANSVFSTTSEFIPLPSATDSESLRPQPPVHSTAAHSSAEAAEDEALLAEEMEAARSTIPQPQPYPQPRSQLSATKAAHPKPTQSPANAEVALPRV